MSERRFRELLDAGIFEKQPKGKYDPDVVRVAYIRHLREAAAGRARDTLGNNKDRIDAANAEMAEMDLAERKHELIRADDVEAALTDAIANMKAKLLSLPNTIAPIVKPESPDEAEKIIREKVNEALEEIARVDVQTVIED